MIVTFIASDGSSQTITKLDVKVLAEEQSESRKLYGTLRTSQDFLQLASRHLRTYTDRHLQQPSLSVGAGTSFIELICCGTDPVTDPLFK